MKCVIDSHVVLSQPPQGPLAVHIEAFAKSLREQGYARYSIHRQVLLAAGFSRWLGQQGVTVRLVTIEHTQRYLRARARRVQLAGGDAAALRHLLDFLRGQGAVPSREASAVCTDQCRPPAPRLHAVPPGGPRLGERDDRHLCAVHSAVPHSVFW